MVKLPNFSRDKALMRYLLQQQAHPLRRTNLLMPVMPSSSHLFHLYCMLRNKPKNFTLLIISFINK